jgi:NAD dependent epimerase/dehydratase family enzyme
VAELLFASQRLVPEVLVRSGFRFEHETIDEALTAVLSRGGPPARGN